MSAEIHLAGTLSGTASVERLSNEYPNQIFSQEAPDDLEEVDGVLVGYDEDLDESVVQRVESAYQEGVPVVVFDDANDGDPTLNQYARYVNDELYQATSCLLMYAGVSAEQVISKG